MLRSAFIATACRAAAVSWLFTAGMPNRPQAEDLPILTEVAIYPSSAAGRAMAVPRSFLGLSQEWPWVSSMTLSPHATAIIHRLQNDNGPMILRVGGTSYDAGYERVMQGHTAADRMQRDGVAKSLTALETLRDTLGMRFILTLSLACRDPTLVKQQADAWQARLGDAVVAFEIGNEPNYYKDIRRDLWPDDGSGRFYRDIVDVFAACSRELEGRAVAGPAWGWIGLRPPLMEQYLAASPRPLAAVTVHYYHSAYHQKPPPGRPNDTPETLLDDRHTREVMNTWVGPQLKVASRQGVPLRITECNSISGGGNAGVSDVYAAALWTLDTALEMAAAGVAGIDFHQASWKYALYERVTHGSETVSGFDPPPLYHSYRVRPPFYGLLFFQKAVTAGSRIARLEHSGPAALKAYAITVGDESRTVLVNKSAWESVGVTVHRPRVTAEQSAVLPLGRATLIRLEAPAGSITARRGITIAGVGYDDWGGRPDGEPVRQALLAQPGDSAGEQTYRVELGPASAAILRELPPDPKR